MRSIALVFLSLAACGNNGGNGGNDAGPGGADGGSGGGGFDVVTVDSSATIARPVSIAVAPNGALGVAYEVGSGTTGACTDAPSVEVRFARVTGLTVATPVKVDAVHDKQGDFGVSLAFDAAGHAQVAYVGGDNAIQTGGVSLAWCESDATLAAETSPGVFGAPNIVARYST